MKKKLFTGMAAAVLLAAFTFVFSGCGVETLLPSNSQAQQSSQTSAPTPTPAGQSAQVYYLDVGQGDSQLIRLPDNTTVLIDAGDRNSVSTLVPYLQQQGVTKIDLLIATHPHADHIGAMANVIRNFEIGKIYLPRVADSQTPTTKTYEVMLEAISKKKLKMTQAKAGMTIYESDGAKLEFLAPNSGTYEDLNNYSIVTKLTYGNTSFLFMGDAESESEGEILQNFPDSLACDVLKLGHHGSSTSSSDRFLEVVQPRYGVISCGVDNDYGHPHRETVNKMDDFQVITYRTDTQGTILASTDGSNITFTTNLPSVIEK